MVANRRTVSDAVSITRVLTVLLAPIPLTLSSLVVSVLKFIVLVATVLCRLVV